MITIKCPKCQRETSFSLNASISEDGEVYKCDKCGYKFRFVDE